MKYTISYSNPLTHLIDITLEIDHIKEAVVYLQLPSWRPGRYEIANFAKNILRIEALNNKGDQFSSKLRQNFRGFKEKYTDLLFYTPDRKWHSSQVYSTTFRAWR